MGSRGILAFLFQALQEECRQVLRAGWRLSKARASLCSTSVRAREKEPTRAHASVRPGCDLACSPRWPPFCTAVCGAEWGSGWDLEKAS